MASPLMKYIYFHFTRWNKSHIHDKNLNILCVYYEKPWNNYLNKKKKWALNPNISVSLHLVHKHFNHKIFIWCMFARPENMQSCHLLTLFSHCRFIYMYYKLGGTNLLYIYMVTNVAFLFLVARLGLFPLMWKTTVKIQNRSSVCPSVLPSKAITRNC